MKAYLAGPCVFLPHAEVQAARKLAICDQYGIEGLAPLDSNHTLAPGESLAAFGLRIAAADEAMVRACDLVIANLTPFRGPSADSGTVYEIGYARGLGKPVFGYSNAARMFGERSKEFVEKNPDPIPGLMLEGLDLPDNLMIPGGLSAPMICAQGQDLPFDSLELFERCVELASRTVVSQFEIGTG